MQESITGVGFEKTDLKTTNFEVSPHFTSIKDKKGEYKRIFDGYVCHHQLKLEFSLDIKKMSTLLSALAKCASRPDFSVAFTVKDKDAVSESLLVDATENARAKAAILAQASGVTLGQIINIDYNWGELRLFSQTRYNDNIMMECEAPPSIDIEPQDIDVSDSVTFVWELI